jgi:tripartite-type tricarboxylate transporter receptor subunit TctC
LPFAAGGPAEKVACDLAEALRKNLNNQTVVVENVIGAGGTLGAAKVARAAPRRLHAAVAPHRHDYRAGAVPHDAVQDAGGLRVSRPVNEVPMTIIGRPTLPANNFAELVKWMEANKGKINLANAGLGAASHLCGLLFQQSLQIDMTTVPYKGTAPAMTDLLGGQVDLMCDQTTNTSAQIEGDKVKSYAVTSLTPLTAPALAKLPTLDSLWPSTRSSSRRRSPSGAPPSRPPGNTPTDGRHAAASAQVICNGIVTGPSLTRCSFISAPKVPASTRGCCARASASTRS